MHQFLRYSLLLLSCCAFSYTAQAQIPYGNNITAGKYISLNNTKLYYETYGSGAPLILIHGNSTGIKGWAAQIEYFSKNYTVYAIDCRGRGNSPLGKDTLSYIQQADDIAAFIRQLKLDTVNVIGKSDGGIIAIMMCIYYPEHLNKVVAFGANMWPDSTALYPNTVTEAKDMRIKAEQMIAQKDKTDNWNLVWQRNHMMETQPHIITTELHRIKTPVLILSCDRDLIREEHTLFIYQHIPNAHLSILAGESHHVAKQNPLLFNTTIDNYFSIPERGEAYRYKQ